MKVYSSFDKITRKVWNFFSRGMENGFVNRQRLSVYLCLVLIVSILALLQYVGFMESRQSFSLSFRLFSHLLFIGVFLAFLFRKLSLHMALSVGIALCLSVNVGVMVCLSHDAASYQPAIVSNLVMLIVLQFLAICSYLKVFSYVIALSAIGAYTYCCIHTDCPLLIKLYGIMLMTFVSVAILGHILMALMDHMSQKNKEIKSTYREIFSLFHMNKSDMLCLLQLAGKKDLSSLQTDKLMELIGQEKRQSIKKDISDWYQQSKNRHDPLMHACPTLSPTQYEICQLVIAGKNVSEIAYLMEKTESNITCQRTRIRSKLNMKKNEDLREVLQGIVKKE